MYFPDIIAFILPLVGFIVFFLGSLNYEINSISCLNLMIYSFWLFLAKPGLISGILTKNSTDRFETTFLSGVIGFPILVYGGYIILFILQRIDLTITQIILVIIFGVIIGIFTGSFGYLGDRIGKKIFSYSRPVDKCSPFELIKRLIEKIIPGFTIKKLKE